LLHHEVTGSGPPVLLVHAAVGDSRLWDVQFHALADEFTVIRCDLPGFGRSPLPAGPCVDADEVAAVLETVGVERAAVVGNSFGGLVAIQLAARHPRLVGRLVLFAPSFEPEPDEKLAAYAAEEERLYEAGDYEGMVELNVRTWVQSGVADEQRRLVREMQRLALELQLQDPDAEPPDVEVDLSEITAPVTIFTGARDFPTYRAIGERLARDLPDARHITLEWAGHLPGIERPEETTELIRASLAR
jgi:pimeloyl-ACP methyl ester carboxylesterase